MRRNAGGKYWKLDKIPRREITIWRWGVYGYRNHVTHEGKGIWEIKEFVR